MSVPCPNGIIKDLRNPYRLMYISLYMERYIDRVWEACRNGCSTKMKNSVYYVWKGCERRMNVYFLGEYINNKTWSEKAEIRWRVYQKTEGETWFDTGTSL